MRGVVLGAAFVFFAGALFAQPKTETFTSTDGRYTVRFPGKPKITTPTAKSAIGDLQVIVATYATADANVYLTSHTDYPTAATKAENRKTLFDGIQNGLRGSKGKIVSEKEFEFGPDKLPGREVVVDKDMGKQRVKFKVVLRDNRLYQIAVIGTADFVSSKDATAFVESLELTK